MNRRNVRRDNEQQGRRAEEAAARYYENAGYHLFAHRLRTPYGELDLVMVNDREVVFVEVKLRTTLDRGRRAFSHRGQTRVWRAAQHVLSVHPELAGKSGRFDLAVATRTGKVDIVPNALIDDGAWQDGASYADFSRG